jgi:hypothetical protein
MILAYPWSPRTPRVPFTPASNSTCSPNILQSGH